MPPPPMASACSRTSGLWRAPFAPDCSMSTRSEAVAVFKRLATMPVARLDWRRRMPDWSDGYITNIDYTSGFYPGLSPHAQNFALLYRGFASPELGGGFTYCELGCGHGFSTALLAAANPQGAFWGIDFNPAHIASAERLKRAAGVENVTFLEQSFVEALKADLPQFDFIALHGVWSWISSDNRRAIVDFLYAR